MNKSKSVIIAVGLMLLTTNPALARDSIPPKGPPTTIPKSLDDIENCEDPVVMVVFGEVSEIGFDWEHPSGRNYGQELRNSDLYEKFGGFYMTSSKALETFENELPKNRFTLLAEWPCLEAAQGFYYSSEYQDILKLREGSGTFQFTVYPRETMQDMNYMQRK